LIDTKTNGILGIPFIAFAPFVGVAKKYEEGKEMNLHYKEGRIKTMFFQCIYSYDKVQHQYQVFSLLDSML
jgi:hypothetical protein